MMQAIANWMPGKLREKWRDSQLRLQRLERQQKETDMFLDLVLADAVHSPDCELGMHAQEQRRAVVRALFDALQLQVAIETGTFIGRTANYLARTFGVPVYSSELVPRHHHTARRMLRNVPNVSLRLQDSRAFLKDLAADSALATARTFFYLDAHWYKDLPLAEELDIIGASWTDYAVLVDDFEVPGDNGYAFDDYGPGKALTMAYIDPLLQRHGLVAYSPSTPSDKESGGRAGYVVLVPKRFCGVVDSIGALRRSST